MRLIFGIKPTSIHLGHILSVFQFIKTNQYTKLDINLDEVYCLIGDIHKFSSLQSISSIEHDVETIQNIASLLKVKYYRQYYLPREYFITYHILSFVCSTNKLDKVFKINFNNRTDNNFSKFSYPVLMCTDIILMQPCIVLVGSDQIHNIRFIVNVLDKLNKTYSLNLNIKFKIIDIKILNLNNENKMSTSKQNIKQMFINMKDNEIYELIMKAKTQKFVPQNYNDLELSTKNLYRIYSEIKKLSIEKTIEIFKDKNFVFFKKILYKEIIELYSFYRQNNKKEMGEYNAQNKVNDIVKDNFHILQSIMLK